ncbi:MAG: sensor histidine kinase [Clostridioides sp.]|jgi:signal transduction histidine kinase|nr:sensor histidine kinase [Clostridioides sp.]
MRKINFTLRIRDEGEGLDKEDARHIFERFYKGKNSSDNSFGIGLALSNAIITKQNGYIEVELELGVGSRFVIKYMK